MTQQVNIRWVISKFQTWIRTTFTLQECVLKKIKYMEMFYKCRYLIWKTRIYGAFFSYSNNRMLFQSLWIKFTTYLFSDILQCYSFNIWPFPPKIKHSKILNIWLYLSKRTSFVLPGNWCLNLHVKVNLNVKLCHWITNTLHWIGWVILFSFSSINWQWLIYSVYVVSICEVLLWVTLLRVKLYRPRFEWSKTIVKKRWKTLCP